jgi:hypothetical protein
MENPSEYLYATLLTPELFAQQFGYPAGMIRLAIDCGLETSDGRVSVSAFCRWLASHHNVLRERAGLPLLASPSEAMTAEEKDLLVMCNVLRTHADYFASRTSSLEYKKEWVEISEAFAQCVKPGIFGTE